MDGVDVVIGTSSFLRKFSHGKDITYIIKTAIEVIEFVKSKGIEVRFSSEDSFRSDLVDLLSIYRAVDKIGVNRVGIADTVGCANPRQVRSTSVSQISLNLCSGLRSRPYASRGRIM